MRTRHDQIRNFIATQISQIDFVAPHLNVDQVYDLLVEPPQSEMGDLAFGCFSLAKTLKKSPAQIANELKAQIALNQNIREVSAAGPYLNFKLSTEAFSNFLLKPIESSEYFSQKLTENEAKTMVEFSQPNTHKELHVGHMRNLCLGDALVRILKYAHYPIVSTTFPGDMGTHVAKCLWYLKFHNQEKPPETGKGEWLGRMYSLAHNKLEDEVGTPAEEKNRLLLTQILQQLEKKQGEFYDLWLQTRQWSIDLMNRIYDWADVHFDTWYWESEVDSDSIAFVRSLLKDGKLIESQGAVGMNLESENLGFCMLLKSDGTGLYATKDLELARRKFHDYHIEKSIYVVDMRQALHFKQVFKVLEKLNFPQAAHCFHLQYNFVELPDGAMSSRKGNIVPLTALIHRMEEMIKSQYLNRYQGEWSEDEISTVATQVAKGAIRYGMLRIDNNKKIVFNMEEWLKIDGESGPFIQYSCARIHSLCRKLGYQNQPVNHNLLIHDSERKLMQSLMHFNSLVAKCAEDYKPSLLCTYLYELAKKFNHFYHECSIGNAENEELKKARLSLSMCTGLVLKKGLSLLGIPAPERM
jgi:arginyl-tRNA synthetase